MAQCHAVAGRSSASVQARRLGGQGVDPQPNMFFSFHEPWRRGQVVVLFIFLGRIQG